MNWELLMTLKSYCIVLKHVTHAPFVLFGMDKNK